MIKTRVGLILILAIVVAGSVIFGNSKRHPVVDKPVEYGIDPVCQMDTSSPYLDSVVYRGVTYRFCSDVCKELFEKDPGKFALRGRR